MATANKYEDMSAIQALEYARNWNLLLPDIQREYVWSYQEVEDLFDSIVDGYPIGSCIFWKTTRSVLNKDRPNLYYFLREFKEEESRNKKAPEVFKDENDYYIVLDGQQRITSLYIALYGSYTSYKGGRGHARNNPNSWVKRELYYNLDYYSKTEEDDEKPKKRFRFLGSDDAKEGNYYKVKNLLAFDKATTFIKELINNNYSDEAQEDLSFLFERLHASSSNGIIHYYCIAEKDYDEALDIFVRVNSTGRKLSKTDLLFSTLINGWSEGRDEIEELLDSMNWEGDGFRFTKDYLMRLSLVLVGANANLKIQSLTKDTIKDIRKNWRRIKSSSEKLARLLADIGLSHETLTSYNATMPIAYYLYKGGSIKTKAAKIEVKKFLSVAMANRLFGVASTQALTSTRAALQKVDCKSKRFSLSLFKKVILTGGRSFIVTEDDIDYWLDYYRKGQDTYVLLSLLYPNLKLSQYSFHQDHCHPYSAFDNRNIRKLNLPDETVWDWQEKRNLLPNLQFLEGTENESKNKTPLKEWVKEGNDFAYRPKRVSLELKNFDNFFNARRELMKEELCNLFGVK